MLPAGFLSSDMIAKKTITTTPRIGQIQFPTHEKTPNTDLAAAHTQPRIEANDPVKRKQKAAIGRARRGLYVSHGRNEAAADSRSSAKVV